MTIEPSLDDPLLTVDEVAKIFSVTPRTVRLWCSEGKLKSVKLSTGGRRVLKSDMVNFANERYGSD